MKEFNMPGPMWIKSARKIRELTQPKNLNSIFPATSKTFSIFKKTKPRETKSPNLNFSNDQTDVLKKTMDIKEDGSYLSCPKSVSCSASIKGFVNRLKSERKNEAKKLDCFTSKIKSESKSLKEKQFYMIAGKNCVKKHSSEILIMGRSEEAGNKSFLKTISVVSENIRISKKRKARNKSEEKEVCSSSEWTKIKKLESLIKEVKKKKIDISNAQEILAIPDETLEEMRMSFEKNFQILPRRKYPILNIKKKNNQEGNFESLDPWRSENKIGEFSIEEYNVDV